ncbi:hNH endonuclease [Escherichia coli]|uniref:hNH endonuclease n=1 Tax=Escherichia coli TaxID=562 RepID=UPI00351D7919
MKQMSLIEMDGFLKGKCIPSDLKVNETNAEYLVRKFGELESKLETALRECRSAGITIDNLEAKCTALAAENAGMKSFGDKLNEMHNDLNGEGTGIQGRAEVACQQVALEAAMEEFDAIKTPATDAFLAEVRAQGLNAFIQHRSAELDAHIKNGGEQFDEKSVRIRDIIVSARLFREQIRKEAAQ